MMNNRQPQHNTKSYYQSRRPKTSYSKTTFIPSRLSLKIDSIITSLERNVQDLKNHYRMRQKSKPNLSLERGKSKFRLKKIKNESHCCLSRPSSFKDNTTNELVHSDIKEKQLTDVFELKTIFAKTYGRDTNSIVQLYQFYKKNLEKREKSTRILASIDISNPNMGLSQEGELFPKNRGKESLSRRENGPIHKQPQQMNSHKVIAQKLESSSKNQHSSNIGQSVSGRTSKPSNLASEMISKGLYNISNVANLMLCKKYKLTKEKEESFQKAFLQREKVTTLKLEQEYKENDGNLGNIVPNEKIEGIEKEQESKEVLKDGNNLKNSQNSSSNLLDCKASFQSSETKKNVGEFSLQSPKKSEKNNIDNDPLSSAFEMSSIKKQSEVKPNIDDLSSLQESPIVIQKVKDFCKSKYYVQPIPAGRKMANQQKSLTLRSDSRIIDIDSLPFDL